MNNIKTRYGSNLRRIRTQQGYSQRRLEDLSGIGHAQISKMESGKVNVSIETLAVLATALQVDPADLLKS